ncbi:anti-sigma F factor [Desulfovirgula thermocuniculi]|uniref:anti-sigma F factor n=1 Tax=Desulfovirgula thermocuniculi TaxID=348842 RepID=UPI003CCBE506
MEFPSLPENVAFARVAVASFASQLDFTIHDIEEIKVAVSEAVANAIVHGYGNSRGGLIRVCLKLTDEALEIQVEDHGKGIEDVKKALEPTYSTDPERMGLGFVFMQAFMDYLHVDSAPGKGTRVTMVKNVPRGAAAAASEKH